MSPTTIADFAQPMYGAAVALASGIGFKLAQTVDVIPEPVRAWGEFGGTLGFIGGLLYGLVTLWKALQDSKKEIADLNKQIRDDWKTQNDKLIAVLERLDHDNN